VSDDALPRSTPSAEGVAASGIESFLDAVDDSPDIALHSLMICRHGQVVAEDWWAPYRPDDVHLLYSVSKSFTATALGFAVAEDRLRLPDLAVDHLGNLAEAAADRRMRAITVDHLARMATGHTEDTLDRIDAMDLAEPVLGFLGLPPDSEPGSVFAYNNGATYVLAAIIQRCTGESLTDYLQPRLFDPLGVARPYWQTLGGPREVGFTGLHLTTEAIARFAELYRCDGRWRGRQVLPAGWAAQATQPLTANPAEPNPDWRRGYGYQFWRSLHGYRADGAYGQFGLVLPEQEAVVVTTAETENMQGLLDAVWTHLVPAFGVAGSAVDDERLADRLQTLAVWPETRALVSADDWLRATGMTQNTDGWSLTVTAEGRELEVGCGDRRWRRNSLDVGDGRHLLVEAAGDWPEPDVFTAELIFVQTPHRVQIRYAPATGTSTASWQSLPLGRRSLLKLATPRTP
jgi:CubicO group peptidase (beta-lactamase class C family)